ncbi:MAG TPA: NACHT domain-containing protein, partial [Micromonosporaceae bacterium]|nr:NACHT domain-containing protein [Micromonosporaceae bacterium]
GDIDDMVRTLARLPSRQLVVIGAPGAGKSTLAVLLTLGLLARWQPGEPVPVLLTLASWDPGREHLGTWLARRLAEAYPGLGTPRRYGADAPARLVAAGLVRPVLDGLDEMPASLHARAVAALTAAVGRDRPLVLTSRAEEYQSAVRQAGEPLARAAVVEIEPVTAADAADYLTAGQVDGRARWRPVLDELAAAPDGALARALRTPLMVHLARVAYRVPDPAGLLSFTGPDTIAAHLLDAYLPAVYAHRTPPPPDPAGHLDRPPARGYPPQQAQRWLGFLAAHLTAEGTTDLAWWRLYRAVPHFQRQAGLAYALGAGTLLGLGFGLTFGLRLGAAAGVTFALVAGVGGGLGGGLMVGFASNRVYAVPQELRVSARRPGIGVAVGFVLGFMSWLVLETGLMAGVVFGSTVGLLLGLVAGLGEPATLTRAVTPASTLRNDRRVSSLYGLMFGLPSVLLAWLAFGPEPGLILGLAAGLTFGLLMNAVSGAWACFVVARVLLAVRGRLPYHLMEFLDDAYRRGVLRQVGAVYQFRHARLQQHLAAAYHRRDHAGRD